MFFLDLFKYYKLLICTSCLILSANLSANSTNQNAPWVGFDFSGAACKGLKQAYGPYDYTKRSKFHKELYLVESAHFNRNVETLQGGAKKKLNLYGDMDYTLRAFPNHHRALNTVIRFRTLYGEANYKTKKLSPPECYLQRAVYFAPSDVNSIVLYGILLHKLGKFDEAQEKYKEADKLSPDNPEIQYNLGLLLVDMKRYKEAKIYAVKAYKKKFPLQGLKRKLEKAGKW
jgi:Flp pilus assembly protein TadD